MIIHPTVATVAEGMNEAVPVNSFPTYDVATSTSRDLNKLRILRQQDSVRLWHSLDDIRVCVLCGNEFRGREIQIHSEQGQFSCHCPTPGCRGHLRHFVFPGNPLLDPKVWSDWMLALGGVDPVEGGAGV